jgi:hypothetical protein
MTDENGNLDMSAFMNQVTKDNNMTDEQSKQMKEMMNAIDNMDFGENNEAVSTDNVSVDNVSVDNVSVDTD